MTYLSLSRRWRPQTFEELVGQDHVTRTLANALKAGRIHHAYIFAGSRGVGKTSLARILAKSLNCEKGPTSTPCGQCASCREITASSAMDVIEIDGASNTGVDNIRELREHVAYRPARDRYKIYIIDEVHMLSTSAFNALLKTLEEPPPHVVFIFATTEAHKIPETIHSRCQRFDFALVPIPLIISRLRTLIQKENIPAGPGSLELIAREAGGSLRDAESILDQVLAYREGEVREEDILNILGIVDRVTVISLMEAVIRAEAGRALTIVNEVYARGHHLPKFATQVMERFRDLLVQKILFPAAGAATEASSRPPEELVHLSPAELDELKRLGAEVDLARVEAIIRILMSALEEIGRSPSARIILELALVRAAHSGDILSLDRILTRIDSLEKRLSNPDPGAPAPGPKRPEEAQTVTARPSRPAAPEPPAPSRKDGHAFLSFLRERHHFLADFLEILDPVGPDTSDLRISLSGNPILVEYARDPQNLISLSNLAVEFFGRTIHFLPIDVPGAAAPEPVRPPGPPPAHRAYTPASGPREPVKPAPPDHEPAPAPLTEPRAAEPKSESDLDRHRKHETQNHPLVKEALEILGGELEIRLKKRTS
ncbi:MAG: DNA polymerase III subunit gamma/tau [bacterium]|nr:DNA polymerase III subunit gamma/tau [bacterium]